MDCKEDDCKVAESLDEPAQEQTIVLKSNDGALFKVPRSCAALAVLWKTCLEGDAECSEVPVSLESEVLAKVVEFITYHVNNPCKDIERPLKSAVMTEVVSAWDAQFIDVEQEMLFKIILAANSIDLKSLLDLSCSKVASMIKGKSAEEIRKTFNIQNDFSPQEEEAVRRENAWAEDQ
jgi:S-phase kinase-associated protein 1